GVRRGGGAAGGGGGTGRRRMKLGGGARGGRPTAISASRQFSVKRITTAIARRTRERAGETKAICKKPVVVSTSPVSRERIPPVFISQRRGNGRCRRRSYRARRKESITRVL